MQGRDFPIVMEGEAVWLLSMLCVLEDMSLKLVSRPKKFDTKQTGKCQGLRGPRSGAVVFVFVILKG